MSSFVSKVVVICMLIFVVSAWMSDNLLKLPALEFGEIWVSSVKHIHTKLRNLVSNVTDVHSYMFYIVLILGFILGYYVYNLLFTPLNRVRILGDIGYIPDGKFSLKDIANSVKRRRLVGEVPPVYPNGWFGVMEGFKLKKGEAKNISILGKLSPVSSADPEGGGGQGVRTPLGKSQVIWVSIGNKQLDPPPPPWKKLDPPGKC